MGGGTAVRAVDRAGRAARQGSTDCSASLRPRLGFEQGMNTPWYKNNIVSPCTPCRSHKGGGGDVMCSGRLPHTMLNALPRVVNSHHCRGGASVPGRSGSTEGTRGRVLAGAAGASRHRPPAGRGIGPERRRWSVPRSPCVRAVGVAGGLRSVLAGGSAALGLAEHLVGAWGTAGRGSAGVVEVHTTFPRPGGLEQRRPHD